MDRTAYGTLETIDGRPALRFELALAYPVERVWQAVSDPAELERFFPAAVDWTPAAGETIAVGGGSRRTSSCPLPTTGAG